MKIIGIDPGLSGAIAVMEKNKIFTLVVMENGKNVGILSMHDLIQARIL